ncbi:MAG: redoxin domain-containing protein [Planctomycetota bacterium]
MKRYLISTVAVLMVLLMAWAVFAQDRERPEQGAQWQNMRQRFQNMSEEEREKFRAEMRAMREKFENMSEEEREKFRAEMRERFGGARPGLSREAQLEKVKAIEELVAQLKSVVTGTAPGARGSFRDLSQEERAELRDKMTKAALERQLVVKSIEQQLATLNGPGRPQQLPAGRQPSIGELKAIHDLAVKEKATQTASRLERLIAQYQRESGVRGPEPGPRPERLERPPRELRPARQGRDVQDESSGKKAPEFELNSFDGKTISLSGYRGKIVVLEWFNFECPLSRYHYETKNTMVELANKYKDKNVVWLAVNSTSHTTPEPNKTFAKRHGLPYLILDDRSGKVGRAYGAQTTPHMYVINPRGSIVYEGAIDDSPLGKKKEDVINYVDNALAELTARKAVSTPKTKPYGCTVKYAR